MEVSQSQMTEQIDHVTEWSQCLTCELNRRTEDVQNFLVDEIKKDIPTGYSFYICVITSINKNLTEIELKKIVVFMYFTYDLILSVIVNFKWSWQVPTTNSLILCIIAIFRYFELTD